MSVQVTEEEMEVFMKKAIQLAKESGKVYRRGDGGGRTAFIPDFCFSLGLTINREPVLGVVYLPIGDRMYTAIKDQGAFCNSNKLSVSADIVDVKQAVVMSEGGNHRDKDLIQVQSNNVLKILTNSRGLRAYGSTAIDLCHLASGEGEVYVQYDIHCWDMAAGVIIAREAGATVMDPTGVPLDLMSRRVLAASSETLAKQMSSLLTHVAFGRD